MLQKIRLTALKLEAEHPEWASSFRRDTAILQEASSQFIAKINGLFDSTIDRISARFTANARIITFAAALLVALVLQLDSVRIVNNLWMNDSLRERLIETANNPAASVPGNPGIQDSTSRNVQQDVARNLQSLKLLASSELFLLPASYSVWWRSWDAAKIPGVLLSALLLSLGAPFWYSALKTLLRLRALVADKDDAQRLTRQTSQADKGTGPTNDAG